jgi:ABC-type cobalamin/Fe3+-siderophores transport system ATPase subunit
VLVLDEPTTGMDIVAEKSLLDLVVALREAMNLAVVMISHHLGLVANFVRDVLLVDKDRQKVEHGPVEEVVTASRLSLLYGRNVAVEDVMGHRMVFIDRRAIPRDGQGGGTP